MDLDTVRDFVGRDHGLAMVATTREDGSVQASVVNAGVLAHPVTGGTHDDFEEYDRVMKEDRRCAVLVHPERIYGVAHR